MNYHRWLILIISLPGQSGTPRMRVWRALKSMGAGILRDGVYVLPESEQAHALLELQVSNIEDAGGVAYLLNQSSENTDLGTAFLGLFDRGADYDEWLSKASELRGNLERLNEPEARRKESQLRRDLDALMEIDYFSGDAKSMAQLALEELSASINERFSPDEPTAKKGDITVRSANDFHARHWATRRNMWMDRVASAWLIQRFIDPEASFVWLAHPDDCPTDAIGFDFDGATFSHVENRVTFEVLLRSFELDKDTALVRMGRLVHYVDVGGLPVEDSAGFATLLGGIKQQCADDDALLQSAGALFDHLYAAYQETQQPQKNMKNG